MTTASNRFNVFDPKLTEALELVSDPARTVCCNIVKGEMSGKFDLHNAIFPPTNMHRNEVPVQVTFTMEGYLKPYLNLMLMMYADTMSGPYSCLGLITHDQHAQMREKVAFPSDYRMQFIGINYNPVIREGQIFIPKDTYHVLELVYSRELRQIRYEARRKLGFWPIAPVD